MVVTELIRIVPHHIYLPYSHLGGDIRVIVLVDVHSVDPHRTTRPCKSHEFFEGSLAANANRMDIRAALKVHIDDELRSPNMGDSFVFKAAGRFANEDFDSFTP
jgi:hypothetical protein